MAKRKANIPTTPKIKEAISLGFPKIDERLQARYDAERTAITNENHWANADTLSPVQANNKGVRSKLVSRARYEVENNCILQGIVDSVAETVIGTGCRLHISSGNDKLDDTVSKSWIDWMLAIEFAEKMRLATSSQIMDGESFVQFITNPTIKYSPVQLDLLLTETERVSAPYELVNNLVQESKNYVDGIRFDNINNPISYNVLNSHPSEFNVYAPYESTTVYPEFIKHMFRKRRIGQKRGVPEVTAGLPLLALLRRYTLAVLETAETAANFSGVIQSNGTPDEDIANIVPMETVELAKRMLLTLPVGWTIGQMKAEQPTTQYGTFKNEIVNEIARCILVPRNIAMGDSSNYNYASGRLDGQQMMKAVEVRRSKIECNIYYPLVDMFLDELQITTPNLRRLRDTMEIELFWDAEFHVDPQKEAKAQEQRLLNKTSNLKIECARAGLDYRSVIKQAALEKKMLDKAGLIIGEVKETMENTVKKNSDSKKTPSKKDKK